MSFSNYNTPYFLNQTPQLLFAFVQLLSEGGYYWHSRAVLISLESLQVSTVAE